MKNAFILLILCLFTVSFSASANLKAKKRRKKQEASLMSSMEKIQKSCGTTMETSIDWKSFAKAPEGWEKKNSVSSYCEISYALKNICKEYGGDPVKKFKKFVCSFKKSKSKDRRKKWDMAAKKETLTLYFDEGAANKNDFVKTWLESNLE